MAKILVVDDSDVARHQLKTALETAGHEIAEAADGLAGIEALRADPSIRLVFCDVNMPKMDGITMCEKVMSSPDLPKPLLLFLTTEIGQELKQKAKALGAKGWIVKPFSAPDLLRVVGGLLK